jgi:glucose 1-dehydrogenase
MEKSKNILAGKTAVITGSTRGFGLAMARAYTRAGARVVVTSRSQAAVNQAVETLRSEGGEASGMACDVGERDQVEALAQYALQAYGTFDVWVNNAGVSAPYGPTIHIEPDAFITALKTNIFGVYYGSIYAMRHFLPRQTGKLINILGRGDRSAVPMQNAYASSKTWVRAFTLALAKEYRQSGVGIFAYNPGLMLTDLMEKIEAVAGYEDRLAPLATVMELWANPPEVPAVRAVWLASPATDGRTGLEIKELDLLHLLSGMLRLGVRRLLGQAGTGYQMQVQTIKSSHPAPVTGSVKPEQQPSPAESTTIGSK